MIVELPDVTVIALDCVAHALTRAALTDTLEQIDPYEVIVWSDSLRAVPLGATHIEAHLDSLDAVARCLWYVVPQYIDTSHYLLVQWDGWVIDGSKWTDDWLEYDYIGAPWWHADDRNVGNGGFSLRNADMMKFIAAHGPLFPVFHPEDVALCRAYRPLLEVYAHKWSGDDVARSFSFERTEPPPEGTFGFHGSFNFGRVLNPGRLRERLRLASECPYVNSKDDFNPAMLSQAAE